MWTSLDKAMQYNDRSKFRRPASGRMRIGWMFPLLAICSLLMNASMHLRRTRSVSAIERGPPATNVPMDLPRAPTRNAKKSTPPPKGKININDDISVGSEQKKTTKKHTSSNHLAMPPPKKEKTGAAKGSLSTKKKTTVAAKKEVKPEQASKPEDASPRPSVSLQAVSSEATLSACLLVRDDNEIMNEWIAYHYHVLRMRRMIVAVDPNSETSPSSVLDAWKDHMEIDLWTDDVYMPKEFLETGSPPAEYVENITKFGEINYEDMMGINAHRYRQRYFLGRCYQKFKQEHRSLVLHIDTDEYIVPNKLLRKDKEVTIKSSREPGCMLDLIQQLVQSDPASVGYPCISMLRLMFGSVESEDDEWAPTPSGFDRKSFETLRWRYHGSLLNKKMHGHPKVLVDVSKIPKQSLSNKVVYSIHRPFTKYCRGQGESDYENYHKYPITANHYLGSWERYTARNDTRRTRDMYNARATVNGGEDFWAQSWLEGFIKDVGKEQASRLLGQHYLKTKVAIKTS